MYNKVKSEQCFAATSAKKVAIFQGSLKLVTEDVKVKLFNKDNKHSAFDGQTINMKGDLVTNMMH